MTRVLFVVPGAPYFPSGIVRVEAYLERLRADGVDARVLTYFSPFAERLKQQPSSRGAARTIERLLARVASWLHIAWARLHIAVSALVVDAIVVQWVLPPAWLSRWVAARTHRLVFDFDDAVFLAAPARAAAIVTSAWRVVAGSHMLYEYAHPLNPNTALIPSGVSLESFDDNAQTVRNGAPCIGWIGSVGTLRQLATVAEPLRRLAANGVPFTLLLAGTNGRSDLLPDLSGIDVCQVATYTGAQLPELVGRLDIGIMPLEDTPWARGKCAMKALIYMAGAKPVVLSPVGENRHVVDDGANGLFAGTSDEWFERLGRLLADSTLRAKLGATGRQTVVDRYSTTVCYRELWRTVFSQI